MGLDVNSVTTSRDSLGFLKFVVSINLLHLLLWQFIEHVVCVSCDPLICVKAYSNTVFLGFKGLDL